VLDSGRTGEDRAARGRIGAVPDAQQPADQVLDPSIAARLTRDPAGLVCAVVQEHGTSEVLMVGWMDDEALRRTLTSGRVTFWSRSRQAYWRKGDTSGNAQYVRSVSLDCDGDALLVRVDQVGAACHTGAQSCFEAGGDLGAVVGSAGAVGDESTTTAPGGTAHG
jgi:phosphoribosyl-AMP cyclohydrolase